MKQNFAPNVVQEPASSLNPKLEAYWIQQGKKYDRIVAKGDSVEDGEIAWTQARVQHLQQVQRSLMQRVMKSEIAGAMYHPSGVEVVPETKSFGEGHLFTLLKKESDFLRQVERRLAVDKSKVLKISDQKLFVEGGAPVRISSENSSVSANDNQDTLHPIEKIGALYKKIFESLPGIIAQNSGHLTTEDFAKLSELDTFRRTRVKWATINYDGGLIASEAGAIGDAWIFIVPHGHSMMQHQKTIFSANFDNSGLNPYLSILPYDMTERWAALGAVHELSHLRDAVLGIEPRVGRTRDQYLEGEHKAYSVERALAFAFSQGRIQKALESVVAEAFHEGDAMAAINSLVNQRLSAITDSLDPFMEAGPSKSENEQATRRALYLIMLGFEIARQYTHGNAVHQKIMEKKFIEMIYEPTGHLPKQ